MAYFNFVNETQAKTIFCEIAKQIPKKYFEDKNSIVPNISQFGNMIDCNIRAIYQIEPQGIITTIKTICQHILAKQNTFTQVASEIDTWIQMVSKILSNDLQIKDSSNILTLKKGKVKELEFEWKSIKLTDDDYNLYSSGSRTEQYRYIVLNIIFRRSQSAKNFSLRLKRKKVNDQYVFMPSEKQIQLRIDYSAYWREPLQESGENLTITIDLLTKKKPILKKKIIKLAAPFLTIL